MRDIPKVIHTVTTIFQDALCENLLGIYLHGSLAMGCFHPGTSDIDLLLIVKEKLASVTKRMLIDRVLELSHLMPDSRLEFSIIRACHLKPFQFPTPFELHYSPAYTERYRTDPTFLCENGVDEDLAAHVMVTFTRGKCLYGLPVRELISKVDHHVYLQSIMSDIKYAADEIIRRPGYYVLNLLRVLYYVSEGVISSKAEAGEWGLQHVSGPYQPLVQFYLNEYRGNKSPIEKWTEKELIQFAHSMLGEISECTEER